MAAWIRDNSDSMRVDGGGNSWIVFEVKVDAHSVIVGRGEKSLLSAPPTGSELGL